MKKVYLITSNPGKVESANNILKELNLDLEIEILDEDYPEIKEEGTTIQVALEGAKYCAEKFQKPTLVTDVGIFIKSLNGFPGVNTKFVLEKIGQEGILKLLEDKTDRSVEWILSLGFCQPGQAPVHFTSAINGQITKIPKGDKGFGFDPIFLADGFEQTFGEDPTIRDTVSPFRKAMIEFVQWYK